MANITFILREPHATHETPIRLVCRFGRNSKLVYPLKLKILPKYWNFERQRPRNTTDVIAKDTIIAFLNSLQTSAVDYCTKTTCNGKPITKEGLKHFLDCRTGRVNATDMFTFHGFVSVFLQDNRTRTNAKTGKRISKAVADEHERTYNLICEYEAKHLPGKRLDFPDINIEFYNGFTLYLQSANYASNTIGRKIRIIKTWMNEATERGYNKNMQYKSAKFRAISEDVENIYLTENELKQIYKTDCKHPTLNRVRDLFLIGAYTGLRFSDYTKITPEHIYNDKIHIEQQKTGNPVTIPLHPIVTDILNRHNGRIPEIMSNQKFNDYIKEVCRIAGLTASVQKGITKGGARTFETFEKCNLVTSHTARRSFATNLYLSGFPAISIMQITGHKTEKAFLQYIKVTTEQYAQQLQKHWQQNKGGEK